MLRKPEVCQELAATLRALLSRTQHRRGVNRHECRFSRLELQTPPAQCPYSGLPAE